MSTMSDLDRRLQVYPVCDQVQLVDLTPEELELLARADYERKSAWIEAAGVNTSHSEVF